MEAHAKTSLTAGLVLALAILCGATGARAAESESPDPTMSITLTDGSKLIGQVLKDDGQEVHIRTSSGLEVHIPKDKVASVKELRGEVVNGEIRNSDPNYTRLMFSPTGRPLQKGHGYFSDFYVLFPSISYGLTDNFSIAAGMSVIPGLSLDQQLFYVAPRVGAQISENFAISGGVLYASGGFEDDSDSTQAGIGFGVATIGKPDKSFTAGLGFGFSRESGDLEWSDTPVLMLGGNVRLSNRLALVSENWLILSENWDLNEQPFGVSLRFLGERLTADVGMLLIGDLLDEGLPIPWLSFSYHFGNR